MDNLTNFTLDLFFPKFCLGCQKEGSYLCYDCRHLLDICEFTYCLCERAPRLPIGNINQGKCPKCSHKNLSGLFFALPFKENQLTKKIIYQFKYEPYLKDLAEIIASVLIEYFIKIGNNTLPFWENSILIPVPLDKNKFKTRGYNQSEELAKELSKKIEIPLIVDNLIKMKPTLSQMELSKVEREKNLKDAFAIKNPESLRGKKIFLVDDVYTTGSTMQECAKVLRKSGAKSVWGIAIAREE